MKELDVVYLQQVAFFLKKKEEKTSSRQCEINGCYNFWFDGDYLRSQGTLKYFPSSQCSYSTKMKGKCVF